MSIPRRYRDVLHKLREREVWLVDELPRECNAETLTYLDQKGLISWEFVSWSNQGHGKPPLAVRDGWNKPGITIDRTGDSWERQLAQRRTDGLHPTELKVSPHGQSVLTELAAAETDAHAAENERRLQEESRQAGILAATIRARVRENPALADAIRENYASMCARSNARAAQANLLVDDAVAHHHALREVIALTDPAGQTEGWRRLGDADRLAAALYCIGGVFDTGAIEPLIPYPTDPRGATDKHTRALWNDWLRRLWIRDHDEYRRALRRGSIGAVHLEVVGSRSARGLEDVWEFVRAMFDKSQAITQPKKSGLSQPSKTRSDLSPKTALFAYVQHGSWRKAAKALSAALGIPINKDSLQRCAKLAPEYNAATASRARRTVSDDETLQNSLRKKRPR